MKKVISHNNRSPITNKSIYCKKKNSKFRLFDTVRSSFSALPSNNTCLGNQTCNNLSTTDMTTPSPYPNSKNTLNSLVNSSALPVALIDPMRMRIIDK